MDTQVYAAVAWGVQDRPRTLPSKHTVPEHKSGPLTSLSGSREGAVATPPRAAGNGPTCSQGQRLWLPFRPVSFIRLFCSEFTKLGLLSPSVSTASPTPERSRTDTGHFRAR